MAKKRFFLLTAVFVFCFVFSVSAKSKKKNSADEKQNQAQNKSFPQWLTDEGRFSLFSVR